LAGYGAAPVPWGVKWGGAEQCRFLKNLLLQPVDGGSGLRLNSTGDDLLRLAMQLDREVERRVRHPFLSVRRQLRLPCLWAGFKPADAKNLTGAGPELEAYSRRTGKPAERLLVGMRREYFGLALYPYSWVSHHWRRAAAVFADLQRFPRRQVFSLANPSEDLIGFQDAAEFDLVKSRFRTTDKRPPRSAQKPAAATV